MVTQKIISQAAVSRNITITAAEIQAEADKIRHDKQLQKASETAAWLKEEMISEDDWEIAIQNKILTRKLAETLFKNEVEPYFAQNRFNFDQFIVYQILVPYAQLAQELFYQIEEEEIGFYEAAHLYNVDKQSRYVCGYEVKQSRYSFHPDIAAIVLQDPIPVGILLGPIQTEEGYHLLRIEEYLPAALTPDRRQEIIDKLFEQWLNHELNYTLKN